LGGLTFRRNKEGAITGVERFDLTDPVQLQALKLILENLPVIDMAPLDVLLARHHEIQSKPEFLFIASPGPTENVIRSLFHIRSLVIFVFHFSYVKSKQTPGSGGGMLQIPVDREDDDDEEEEEEEDDGKNDDDDDDDDGNNDDDEEEEEEMGRAESVQDDITSERLSPKRKVAPNNNNQPLSGKKEERPKRIRMPNKKNESP
jgi:hypothetical protein